VRGDRGEPAVTTTVKQRLLAAARIMREKGLCQDGRYTDEHGRVCALRALELAVGFVESLGRGVDEMVAACEHQVGGAITFWSDGKARNAEDVARMFERAAEGVS
jgi:hypothetical protein